MNFVRRLEGAFRHAIVYPTFRRLLQNADVPLPIELSSIRKLLLLRTDRLGDMVVTSSFVSRIRHLAPSAFIGMVVSHRNLDAARLVPGIDVLHVIDGAGRETWRSIRAARAQRYEVVLNLVFNRTTLGGLLSNVISPNGLKVGQGDEKYRFYFNAMVRLDRGTEHMAEVLRSFGVQTFGASFWSDELPYTLHDDPAAVRAVESFVSGLGTSPVLVNLSAGDAIRALSVSQATELIRGILNRGSGPVVVTAAPGEETARRAVVESVEDPRVLPFPREGGASFAELVALVRRCRLAVTPDTSIVHIAGATQTPLLALFVDPFALAEWHPRNTRAEIVQGTAGRPVSSIAVAEILSAFDRLIDRRPS